MKTPTLTIYRRRLPHWRMDGSVYFVTWRLNNWQPILEPDERTDVVDAIKYFAEERYDLLAYVVMDNHVHVLIAPRKEFPLHKIIHTWKSFTARRLQENFGRVGSIWQKEYFDRIVRDEAELIEKAHYILGNPLKRWTDAEKYPWAGYSDVGSDPASLPGGVITTGRDARPTKKNTGVGDEAKSTGTDAGATEEAGFGSVPGLSPAGSVPASLPGVGDETKSTGTEAGATEEAGVRSVPGLSPAGSVPASLPGVGFETKSTGTDAGATEEAGVRSVPGLSPAGSDPASLPGVGDEAKITGTEAGATEEAGVGSVPGLSPAGSVPASLPGVGDETKSTGTEAGATKRTLFLIFNHTITETQRADARSSLGVNRIVTLPPDLKELWSSIPPDAPEIHPFLEPLRRWLQSQAKQGDFVLIQGDFGACFLMVSAAREMGIIPVYSTTRRQASEEVQPDGSVTLVHRFEHVLFRKYGG